jgi:hypothetical protein
MNLLQRVLHRPFFIRLLHWEYWSFNAVYAWVLPIWALLALRARSFFFFSASNPTIESGGFLMESKKKIYDLLPPQFYPRTLLFTPGTPVEVVLEKITAEGFTYPLVAKPDIGGRGRGVQKIEDAAGLVQYASVCTLDYLVQEYAPQPLEVGIFYYRYPNMEMGRISGVVRKEMLKIIGDGISTMEVLLQKEKRFILQLPVLRKVYGASLQQVLSAGAEKELMPYGNHARGAKFLDDTHQVDAYFEKNFDAICRQVDGFYFGRLDVRYNSWEELREGKNFSIIELNGAGSEPTHMYDPRHSIFFAWKEIVRHWVILARISRANHKNGVPYLTFKEGLQLLKDNKAFEAQMDELYG